MADTFLCPACEDQCSNCQKYIYKFADESELGPAGRERRSDTHEPGDQFRCLDCHKATPRISRLVKAEGWGDDFKALSKENRVKFMLQAKTSFGCDLAKLVSLSMTQMHHDSRMKAFTKGGGYVDEEDLNEKYKNKPAQLAAIKANANAFDCPIRLTKLYQDPEYALKDEHREEAVQTLKRQADSKVTVKSQKEAKTAKKPKAIETEVKAVVFTPSQTDKLKTALVKVDKAEENFLHARNRITASTEPHLPKFIVEKAAIQCAAFATAKAAIDCAMEANSGDFKVLMREAGDALKHSKTLKDSLKNMLDEAEAHVKGG